MEVHRAPGPPRTNIVMAASRRLAVLEVGPGRDSGVVTHAGGERWSLQRPPAASEWWMARDGGQALGAVARTSPLREHFELDIVGLHATIVPVSRLWRRHWSVVDSSGRELVEVRQRPFSRTVHDVMVRSGDVPSELPMTVAWVVALVTSGRIAVTRRSRWMTT